MHVVTRSVASMGRYFVTLVLPSLLAVGCFAPAETTKGLPCTDDASCGGLACSFGYCGGPPRCASGAGVGDYCFEVTGSPIEVGAPVTAIAVGPIDAGPWPDVVVASGDDGQLVAVANDGAGGVSSILATTTVGALVTDLGIGAVDDAGFADVVATTASAVTLHPLVAAGGSTTFLGGRTVATGLQGPRKPQIGSFVDDAERRTDIAVLLDDGFDVLPQTSSGSFGTTIHTSVSAPTDLRSLGMAMERVYVAASKTNSVIGHDRRVDGSFSPKIEVDVGTAPERFTIADVDRDGFSDLVVIGTDGGIWLATGKNAAQDDWSLPQKVYTLGWRPSSITAINLDDDVEPEYVIAGVADNGRGDVYLFDNDGDGKPLYGGSLGIDGAVVAVADLDRDGIAELVAGSGDAQVVIARRTVAPPPVGGEESTGSTTSVDPTVDPSDSNPTFPTTMTDPSDTADSMDDSDTTIPSCGDGGGIPIEANCYVIEEVLVLDADAAAIALGDFSGDYVHDLVVATNDELVTGYAALGFTSDAAFQHASEGEVELAIVSFLDPEGFPVPSVVFTDTEGLHILAPGDPASTALTVQLQGAHSPSVVTIDDQKLSRPGLVVAAADGVYLGQAWDQPPSNGLPRPGVVDIATRPFGTSEILLADGVDVRQFNASFAGLTEAALLADLGAATTVGLTSTGYVGAVEDALTYIGYDWNQGAFVGSATGSFGAVEGGFEVGDITGDGFEDLVVVRVFDFDDGPARLLSVVPIGDDGIIQPPIDVAYGIGAVAVDIAEFPNAIYFTTLAEAWGVSTVQRLRGSY
jgi:hypothetical protein